MEESEEVGPFEMGEEMGEDPGVLEGDNKRGAAVVGGGGSGVAVFLLWGCGMARVGRGRKGKGAGGKGH